MRRDYHPLLVTIIGSIVVQARIDARTVALT
jgi:hypothetical protein